MKDKAWNGHFCLPQISFLGDRRVGWFRKLSDIQFHPYVQGHLKFILVGKCCQVWWSLPLIVALRNLRQEDCYEFKTSLNCIESSRACLSYGVRICVCVRRGVGTAITIITNHLP